MNQKKSIQELTFKDNFMFGAVLLDPENCKGVIERSFILITMVARRWRLMQKNVREGIR